MSNILKTRTDRFSHLLKGLRSGCPPHGGIALGMKNPIHSSIYLSIYLFIYPCSSISLSTNISIFIHPMLLHLSIHPHIIIYSSIILLPSFFSIHLSLFINRTRQTGCNSVWCLESSRRNSFSKVYNW